jgi:hypothetical protein
MEYYAEIEAGRTNVVTDTVERLTGRPPRSFAEWARDHVRSFSSEAA